MEFSKYTLKEIINYIRKGREHICICVFKPQRRLNLLWISGKSQGQVYQLRVSVWGEVLPEKLLGRCLHEPAL